MPNRNKWLIERGLGPRGDDQGVEAWVTRLPFELPAMASRSSALCAATSLFEAKYAAQ